MRVMARDPLFAWLGREVVSYEQIIYAKEAGVATITLNRPQILNAFTPIMIDEWVRALEEAKLDPEVRVVIVTGAGRGFCSGADVRSFREREHTDGNPVVDGRYWLQHSVHRVPLALRTLDKPYIAAVNGPPPVPAWIWPAWRISASLPKPPDSR
jgi:enoyl-CoA hydratase/carnithine racemase